LISGAPKEFRALSASRSTGARTVQSRPGGQCTKFFREHPEIKRVVAEIPEAARAEVVQAKDPSRAPLPPARGGNLRGTILHRTSRTITEIHALRVALQSALVPRTPTRFAVAFLLHQPGALFSRFGKPDRGSAGINLVKIESRPIVGHHSSTVSTGFRWPRRTLPKRLRRPSQSLKHFTSGWWRVVEAD